MNACLFLNSVTSFEKVIHYCTLKNNQCCENIWIASSGKWRMHMSFINVIIHVYGRVILPTSPALCYDWYMFVSLPCSAVPSSPATTSTRTSRCRSTWRSTCSSCSTLACAWVQPPPPRSTSGQRAIHGLWRVITAPSPSNVPSSSLPTTSCGSGWRSTPWWTSSPCLQSSCPSTWTGVG